MADIDTEPKSAIDALDPKDQVRRLLDNLPDDVTLEDIQYHLGVVVKVMAAEESLARGEALSQADFEGRFSRWLTK